MKCIALLKQKQKLETKAEWNKRFSNSGAEYIDQNSEMSGRSLGRIYCFCKKSYLWKIELKIIS